MFATVATTIAAVVITLLIMMLIADWKLWRNKPEKNTLKITSHYAFTNRHRFHKTLTIHNAAWPLLRCTRTTLYLMAAHQLHTYATPPKWQIPMAMKKNHQPFVFGVRVQVRVANVWYVSNVKLLDFQEKWSQSVIRTHTHTHTYFLRFWCMATKFNQQIWSVGGRFGEFG